jgi:hypothetical protein
LETNSKEKGEDKSNSKKGSKDKSKKKKKKKKGSKSKSKKGEESRSASKDRKREEKEAASVETESTQSLPSDAPPRPNEMDHDHGKKDAIYHKPKRAHDFVDYFFQKEGKFSYTYIHNRPA